MHNLATIDGAISMAYTGKTPWHSLGTRMRDEDTKTVDGAMRAARLDWTVSRHPLYLADGTRAEDVQAIMRDTAAATMTRDHAGNLSTAGRIYLGSVGADFTPVQNTEAFGILSDACRDFGVTIASAGALGKGERVWMLAQMAEKISPATGDNVNGYFLVTNGHDGSASLSARLTPIRVVCQNTLNAATNGNRAMIALRHTTNVTQRVGEAKRMIDQMHKAMIETGKTYAQMADREMTPAELKTFIETVIPSDAADLSNAVTRRRVFIAHLFTNGVGADLAPRTVWTAYNAVTEYVDHVRPAEAKSLSAAHKANVAAIFGAGDAMKLRALAEARKMLQPA